MRLSEKRYLHRHSGARRTSEPETSLSLSEESLLPAQSFFAHTSTERPVYELSSCQRRISSREMESERIRILLERQQEQILAEVRSEIQKHEFQADSDGSIQELNGIIEILRREINRALAGDEQLRQDQ